MHPRILAQREAAASSRTVAAASKLAERYGLHEEAQALHTQEKQPEIQQMVRNEAVADFLERLVHVAEKDGAREAGQALAQRLKEAAPQGLVAFLAVLGELPGIGPKTIEGFTELFAQPSQPVTPPPAEVPAEAVGPVTVETIETVDTPADDPKADVEEVGG